MENTPRDTSNFLNWVEIKNFKSIKDLRLDCKRVNVFIGKPNVGKSNILEGLGLLGAGYSTERFLNQAVRYKDIGQLFYDNDVYNTIRVITNHRVAILKSESVNSRSDLKFRLWLANKSAYEEWKETRRNASVLEQYSANQPFSVDRSGQFSRIVTEESKVPGSHSDAIKKYYFANLSEFEDLFHEFLLPPNGSNLYEVIRRNKDLASEFARLFAEQNLEFVLYDEKQEIILQKKTAPFVIQYPFFSIADTFRRFMFYITAIESNTNSVIIFEEPEVHSFPPYTQDIAYRMIYSEVNQFFVSTHSPHLLHTLIENLEEEQLNVFVTYYENYETKVVALTTEDLRRILDFSTDVFFNLDKFIPNAGHSVSA